MQKLVPIFFCCAFCVIRGCMKVIDSKHAELIFSGLLHLGALAVET
jgi:hypothetical protein